MNYNFIFIGLIILIPIFQMSFTNQEENHSLNPNRKLNSIQQNDLEYYYYYSLKRTNPIVINGNAQLYAYEYTNGWNGDGTSAYPITIPGLFFGGYNLSTNHENFLSISNVNIHLRIFYAYFVFTNLEDNRNIPTTGILLNNCSNIEISYNYFDVKNVNFTPVQNMEINFIKIVNSSNIILSDNYIASPFNSNNSITLTQTSFFGLHVSNSNVIQIQRNYFENNTKAVIIDNKSTNVNMINNNFVNNTIGTFYKYDDLDKVIDNNAILYNHFIDNDISISIQGSFGNITNNIFLNSKSNIFPSIYVSRSLKTMINRNVITGNFIGISLISNLSQQRQFACSQLNSFPECSENANNGKNLIIHQLNVTITENQFEDQINTALYIGNYTDGNIIYNNNFGNRADNTSLFSAVVGFSQINTNDFTNGIIGNYWIDYKGYDSNFDGIGDSSFLIDTNNFDSKPLINPVNISKDEFHYPERIFFTSQLTSFAIYTMSSDPYIPSTEIQPQSERTISKSVIDNILLFSLLIVGIFAIYSRLEYYKLSKKRYKFQDTKWFNFNLKFKLNSRGYSFNKNKKEKENLSTETLDLLEQIIEETSIDNSER